MPRLMYGLPGNIPSKYFCQPSVIEFPRNTTRFSFFTGGGSLALASRNLARFAQSLRSCCSVGCASVLAAASTLRRTARQRVFISGSRHARGWAGSLLPVAVHQCVNRRGFIAIGRHPANCRVISDERIRFLLRHHFLGVETEAGGLYHRAVGCRLDVRRARATREHAGAGNEQHQSVHLTRTV